MDRWTVVRANEWYRLNPWLVGCNYIPSSAVNQLEMWQPVTYDPETIDRELSWAEDLGFNMLRVFLHNLVWSTDRDGFIARIVNFLAIAGRHGMKVIPVLFDDCHRPDPSPGIQPLPVAGVHNSGWKHSPGQRVVQRVVQRFHDGTLPESEKVRLAEYVGGILTRFADDDCVLMWDIYNEPGQSGNGDDSSELLIAAWRWAREAGPSQPLTACLEDSIGERNIATNASMSDIITFHCYFAENLEKTVLRHKNSHADRPVICTEFMAREHGTTFQFSLPIFRNYNIGCCSWGLVAGKSQTHFSWKTVERLEEFRKQGRFLGAGDPIPEPQLWFHDIFRVDGTPFDRGEVDFIRSFLKKGGGNPV